MILDYILITLFTFYLFTFLIIFFGWTKRPSNQLKSSLLPPITVIIAARNEESNLPWLIRDLEDQDFPASLFEVIIIDDHSVCSINSLDCIRNSSIQRLIVKALDDESFGKKAALAKGVELSTSELLVFTDADCRLQKGWISAYANYFVSNQSDFIIGVIDYIKPGNIYEKFARLEQTALTVCTIGTALIGCPTMANGANMGIRKNLFLVVQHSIKTQIPSGDDIFLLHAAKKQKDQKITALRDRNSVTYTSAPASLRELINQRARWASKSKAYTDVPTIFLAMLILLTNLALIYLLLKGIIERNLELFILSVLLKTIADCLIIAAGLVHLKNGTIIFLAPLFIIFYPFYMLGVLYRGFVRGFIWKGRLS